MAFGVRHLAVAAPQRPARLVPFKGPLAGDLAGEVETFHGGRGCGPVAQGVEVEFPSLEFSIRVMGHHAVHCALLAQAVGQFAGVDPGHGDQLLRLQPLIQAAAGTEIGGLGDGGAQYQPAGGGDEALHVLIVGTSIADMGKGETNDLSGIGGIGEDFLIAGHGGVETELALGNPGRARAMAGEHAAIGQHQHRRGRRWYFTRFPGWLVRFLF